MITLYGSNPGFGLPETSPYVMKAELHLKMAGLPYRKEPATPQMGPKGKIPFIDDDGTIVGDTTFIRSHIEAKYRVDLDAGLSERQRAEAWAIERMLEDHLGWASANARWLIPENFAKGPGRWFEHAPDGKGDEFRAQVLARVAEGQRMHGMGRHAPEEIVTLGTRSLAALSTLLADRPCITGDRISGADATAAAILAGLLTPFFDSPLRRRAEGFSNLVAYTGRMMERFYPEHSRDVAAPPPMRDGAIRRVAA